MSDLKNILQEFFPKHEENKMKDEGDVESARKYFIENSRCDMTIENFNKSLVQLKTKHLI